MRFYVYRRGYNSANNSARDGGPETVMVAEVKADNKTEACMMAREAGVTCYNGQSMWGEDADEVDRKEGARKKELDERVKLF
jgi:hypothetical protein